jgi:hypothetical protein
MAQAEKTARKAALADRLINGLSGENKRWSETIARLEVTEVKLVGDVLLAAAFVSYAGPFNMQFRQQLVNEKWTPDLIERAIPMTQGGRGCWAGAGAAAAPAAARLCRPSLGWELGLAGSWASAVGNGCCDADPTARPPPLPSLQASSRWTCSRTTAPRPSGPTRACPPTR